MRSLVRLVVAIAAGAVAIAAVAITVPLVVRGVYRHGSSTLADRLAPLTAVTDKGSTVYAANGQVLAVLHSSVTREPVALSAIPKILVHAVLDTEDERFYEHGGIDVPSMVRALLNDSQGGGLQGGSTITQQLVKQVYLTSQRTISRKIREAVIANRLQRRYSKNQILNAYLNTVYLGSGAYGVQAATETYWHEKVGKVTLPQAALLAGLIQNPSGYDPVANPAGARYRRGQVLSRMVHYHTITPAAAAKANAAPLPTKANVHPAKGLSGVDGYYVAQVERQLLAAGSPLGSSPSERYAALFNGGLKIYTNLDPTLQNDAETAVREITPANSSGYQEALVSIQPSTGEVEALIAGQNYAKEQFDVVTQGLRQPGSGFKIFTLLAALEHGDSIFDPVDGTSPCAIPFPGNDSLLTHPAHNDEGDGQSGVTTIQEATAQSLNCAYLRMAHQVGLSKVIATAEKLGIPASELRNYADDPSVVIGAAGVSPLQMSDAYATLANGGIYRAPQFINHVVDSSGDVIYKEPTAGTRVIPSSIVPEADAAFEAVVQSGTGTAAQIAGRQVAGKTGTNSGPTDAWFNGFTPQLESTVWMGYPPADSKLLLLDGVQVYGGMYPCQTVHAYLEAALADQPVVDFPPIDYAALPPTRPVPEVTGRLPGGVFPGSSATTVPYYYYGTTTTLPAYPPSTLAPPPPSTTAPPTSSPPSTAAPGTG
ncbi:MAG TPA: transglycosylase domain-containing protein [Acidimicrobiales bacterium]|nr:transglycosylase domain-containing protein [Acidimicrobiales bacterium]